MGSASKSTYFTSLALLAVAASISILWGISLERGRGLGVMGFPGIYFGTKCLLHSGDPYDVRQLQAVFEAAGYGNISDSSAVRQSASLYVNLPVTFLVVAPFALLPLGVAQGLWLTLVIGSFLLATFLMWRIAHNYSPSIALLLTFIVLSNCEILFSGGNTAGLVVSLCVIATWCFLRDRYIVAGIVCLGLGLAIKPHDAGMVWLYFLLAGGIQRRRALRSCIVCLVLLIPAILWVMHAAPHWIPELQSNLATISGPGGINEPGPTSIGVSSPDMIIDLQTFVSVLVDDPRIYDPITYTVWTVLFLTWLLAVLRLSKSGRNAWYALVSAAAMSMLVTYHRSYDARLLLLAIPACSMLWLEGGILAWTAVLLTAAGVILTADIPLAILTHATRHLYSPDANFARQTLVAVVTRPAPFILLAIAVFYLCLYLREDHGASVSARSPSAQAGT